MLNLSYTDKIDYEKYEELIGASGTHVYVDVDKLYEVYGHFQSRTEALKINLSDSIAALTKSVCTKPTPEQIKRALLEFGGIKENEVLSYSSSARRMQPSAAIPVLSALLKNLHKEMKAGKCSYLRRKSAELIEDYIKYRELAHATSNGESILQITEVPEDLVGWGGVRLGKVPTKYSQRVTTRYYTSDSNIQGWNAEYNPCMTVPAGYYLWSGDLKQIDLRVFLNAFLLSASSDHADAKELLASCDDRYEAFVRFMYKQMGQQFYYAEFKASRDRYKTGILACLYGISEGSLAETLDGDVQMAQNLISFFANNAAYQKFQRNIEAQIRLDAGVIIYDYFGIKRVMESSNRLIRQCLNQPIQCGSNSVVILWVCTVIQRFRDLGYTSDDVRIYLGRHDEALVQLSVEAFKDAWILDDCCKIQVDDWDLLELEHSVGIYYDEEVPQLMEKYKEICEKNKHRYTPQVIGAHHKYTPAKPVVHAYMYSAHDPVGFVKYLFKNDPRAVKIDDQQSALTFIEEQKRTGSGYTKECCYDYSMLRGRVAYEDPETDKWVRNASLEDLLELDAAAVVVHNSSLTKFSLEGETVFKYMIDDVTSIKSVLSGVTNREDRLAKESMVTEKPRKQTKSYSDRKRDAKIDVFPDDEGGSVDSFDSMMASLGFNRQNASRLESNGQGELNRDRWGFLYDDD